MNSKLNNKSHQYSKNGQFFSLCEKGTVSNLDPFSNDCYRIVILPKGKYVVTVDFKVLEIEGNAMIFAVPGQKLVVKGKKDFESIAIAFNQEFYCIEKHDKAVSCNGFLFNNFLDQPFVELNETEINKIYPIIESVKEEFPMMEIVQEEMLKIQLKHLLIVAVRVKLNGVNKIAAKSSDDHELVRNFNRLIADNFTELHLVSDYANKLLMSPEQLSRKIKSLTNKSPIEIIHNRIILEAKRKLKYSNYNIKEVAYELGFNDATYFSKVFKKHVGLSPKRFKSEVKI